MLIQGPNIVRGRFLPRLLNALVKQSIHNNGRQAHSLSHEQAIEAATKLTFEKSYDVELTPPLKQTEADFSVQPGHYNALWLRVLKESFSHEQLAKFLPLLEKQAKAAVYITFEESIFSGPKYVPVLRSRGYKFHHFHHGEFVYYRWVDSQRHDMVPAYATSIEGGAAIVISPDMEHVLVVKELRQTHWSLPGGAINPSESAYEGMKRELREETGVEVDPDYAPLLVCVSNQPRARDNHVNDHWNLFVVRAMSTDYTLDPHELATAHWFPKRQLLELARDLGMKEGSDWVTAPDGQTFHPLLLRGLHNWQRGKYLERTNAQYLKYPVKRDWYW